MKILLIVILFISSLFSAKLVEPREVFKASGRVVDIVHKNDKLYAATNAGCVDVFDMKIKEIISKIKIDPITDFMGDVIESKVYSVDLAGDRILLLSQDKKGYRRVHIFEDNKGELIISYKDRLSIAKAKFIDENNVLFALLSNELISYDIKNKKENWTVQVSGSKFSNFVLSEDKSEVVVADESGDLKIHSTKDGSFIKKLSEQNLDNVFQVDYKNSIIATAGQDRRVVIYDLKRSSAYYKSSDFLIYSVGLSPSGDLVAYSSDEKNNITIFNTKSEKTVAHFGGNKMTLNTILFLNESEFLVSSDDSSINLYEIK